MRTSPLQNRPVHRRHSKREFKVQFIGGGANSGAGEHSAYGESRVWPAPKAHPYKSLGQRPRNSDTFKPSTEGAIQRCIGLGRRFLQTDSETEIQFCMYAIANRMIASMSLLLAKLRALCVLFGCV